MRLQRVGMVLASALLLIVAGCGGQPVGNTSQPPAVTGSDLGAAVLAQASGVVKGATWAQGNPTDARVVAADTDFSFRLYQQLRRQDGGKNTFVSPFSIAMALGLVYNGAAGQTQAEMAKTLGISGMSLADFNQGNADLWVSLNNADPKTQLSVANSIWVNTWVSVAPGFLQRDTDYYGARVQRLDFAAPGTAGIINGWVNQQTHGKIDKVIDKGIDPTTIMYLINAIYFKGTWTSQFDPQETVTQTFTLANGRSIQQPLMHQHSTFPYLETSSFQAVKLPYGNTQLSMEVFLPKRGTTLRSFEASLTSEQWKTWMKGFAFEEGTIALPRFATQYSSSLNDVLSALGMPTAFQWQQADFSGMVPVGGHETYIGQVLHKSYIKVNESGTEAAAVTSISMLQDMLATENPTFVMTVDHPFFFAITDNTTGSILFMGSITNPQA